MQRRSKLEDRFETILKDLDVDYQYEVTKIPYVVPESNHNYTVDWTTLNGMLIETKGYLSDHAERRKYVLIKEQHPTIDLRFVFDNPNKLCGGTKMSHAKWADKYLFKWCGIKDVEQITSWLKESNETHGFA
jgi:hypothetical protein